MNPDFTSVMIDGDEIHDWDSFHSIFQDKMGFPEFYGANVDAWIDCMTYLERNDGMTKIHVAKGGVLVIRLLNAKNLKARFPEAYDALIECSSFVNYRRMDVGDAPVLALAFHD